MFEFTGSLADWLGIVVSLASLAGGAGAGVYLGGVRRTRLDDRRELLFSSMAWLRGSFPVELDRNDPGATKDRLMASAVEQIDEINQRVRLLPWKDRALWYRVVAVAVESGPPDQLFRIATRQFTGSARRHAPRPPATTRL